MTLHVSCNDCHLQLSLWASDKFKFNGDETSRRSQMLINWLWDAMTTWDLPSCSSWDSHNCQMISHFTMWHLAMELFLQIIIVKQGLPVFVNKQFLFRMTSNLRQKTVYIPTICLGPKIDALWVQLIEQYPMGPFSVVALALRNNMPPVIWMAPPKLYSGSY